MVSLVARAAGQQVRARRLLGGDGGVGDGEGDDRHRLRLLALRRGPPLRRRSKGKRCDAAYE